MKRFCISALIYLFATFLPLSAGEIKPWPYPFMRADGEVLTTAAKAVYADDPPQQLWREVRFDIDREGRRTQTERNVFYVANHTDLETYSHLSATWLPWYQARPNLRARVVHPDGSIYQLDPADIVTGSAAQIDPDQFAQAHSLTAPLPRLIVGAVIETEVVIPAIRPVFAGGDAWFAFFLAGNFPQQIRVSTPDDIQLQVVVDPSCEATPHTSRSDGQTLQTWTLTKAPEPMTTEEYLRLQSFTRGRLAFGTGSSWQQVGAAYGAVVDQYAVLDAPPFDLEALLVPGDARATAARFLHEIQKTVRYTGLYLGDKNFIPTPPAEILRRGFGDCKDGAVLLIALLRKVGFDAQIALVHSTERNLPVGAPGLGFFNHAIVVVRGDQPVWIDTTVSLNREGTLPYQLHGTRALIAAQTGAELVTIADADPAEHGVTFDMTYTVQTSAAGVVEVQTRPRGNQEVYYRHHFRDQDPPASDQDGSHSETARLVADDLSAPWTETQLLKGKDYLKTDYRTAAVILPMAWLITVLPGPLLFGEDQPRQPVLLSEVGTYQINYHFKVPDGYVRVAPLPDLSINEAHFKFRHEPHAEDPNRGALVLTLHPGHLPVEEVTRINEWLRRALQTNVTQAYYHETYQSFLGDNPEQSFATLRREIQAQPSFANHMRLALNFSQWGMVDAAVTQVTHALAQPHTAADALAAASLLLKNYEGTDLGLDYPREQAQVLLDQEVAQFPEEPVLALFRAAVRDQSRYGMLYPDPQQLARSGADYARLGLENMNPTQINLYLWNRLWAGDLVTAQRLAQALDGAAATAFQIVITAIHDGPDQALAALAKEQDEHQRRIVLSDVFDHLTTLRYFDEAIALLEGGLPTEDIQRMGKKVEGWRQRRRNALQSLRENDPRTPVVRLAVNQMTTYGDKPFAEQQIFCEARAATFTELRPELTYMGLSLVREAFGKDGSTQAGLLEAFLPTFRAEIVAAAPNHKNVQLLKLSFPHMSIKNSSYYWVVRERAGYRLAGSLHSLQQLTGAIEHALTHKQLKPAVAMLDYLLAEEQAHLWDHQIAEMAAMWAFLKKHGKQPLQDFLILIGGKTQHPERVFPKLIALAATCDDQALAHTFTEAIALAQLAHDLPDEALATYEALYQRDPTDGHALTLLKRYRETQRFDKHAALLAVLQAKSALLSPSFRREIVKTLKVQGRLEELKIIEERECNEFPDDHVTNPNNFAWLHLFVEDADLDAALAHLEHHPKTSKRPTYLHTLATLYATQGRNLEAVNTLKNRVKIGATKTYNSPDLYVLGLVAENLGFLDIARNYYTRVEVEAADPLATEKLARRRLAAIADTDAKETAAVVQ